MSSDSEKRCLHISVPPDACMLWFSDDHIVHPGTARHERTQPPVLRLYTRTSDHSTEMRSFVTLPATSPLCADLELQQDESLHSAQPRKESLSAQA